MFPAMTVVQAQTTATLTIQANQPGAVVSSNLFGIFFEEINFAGEGGIYAEMVRNRSFYDATNADYWTLVQRGTAAGTMSVDSTRPLNTNILNSLKLTMQSGTGSVGAGNSGFLGMSLQAGTAYNLNFYAAGSIGFTGPINAQLESSSGNSIYAQTSFSGLTTNWQLFSASLVPGGTDTNAQIVLSISNADTVWLDVVSLFPQATYLNRSNGMRADLADTLSALQPSFLRFPGGNFIEGSVISNAFRWKTTIGDIAERPGHEDPWNYWSTDGLGYHEYLQFCEDLGMAPLFDINCGLALGYNGATNNTVPINEMGPWVQDALDAIEYANGDTNTTWGAERAANGHPAPFNLQYIEIGNENGGTYYNERYPLFYNAIKSNYPAMHIIAPDWGGIPSAAPVEIEDQHYYSDQGTFISYATMYDTYSRAGPKVFVGEYAVTANYGAYDNLASALGEAAFMTGMERNSDVVLMASYAPLFANVNGMQWQPDMIYYDSARSVFGTPSYYVQQMFSQNRGDVVLPMSLTVPSNAAPIVKGAIGVGSWNTSVQYTNIVVTSNNVTLYQSDFVDDGTSGWNVFNGTWGVNNGLYQQTAIITDCYSTTGNTNWANYTITLQARKVSGDEGFLILFNVLDNNDWTWWNIGGWSDTLDGIEQTVDGNKTTYAQVSQFIATNTWYYIRIVVTGARAQCYLGTNSAQAATNLVQDVTLPAVQNSGLLASSTYASGTGQVIVKAVNPYSTSMATTFNVNGVGSISSNATVIQLTSDNSGDENIFLSPTYIFPVMNSISNAGTNFALTLPANSLSILRLNASGIETYTNLELQCPSPVYSGQLVASTVLGQFSGDWINLTANTNHAITWSSADTNIAVVDVYGDVTGVGSGMTSIIASYASLGLSATQAIQVSYVPTTLMHRYSFTNGAANDLIGAANGTLVGNATISGGQLVIPNKTSAAPATDYLELPAGILTNAGYGIDPAVTVEAWTTISPNQYTWANLFDFGNRDANGQAEYDIHVCVHSSDNSTISGISDSDNANVDYQYIDLGSGTSLDASTNVHVTAVYDPPAGYEAIYLNGVLAGVNDNVTIRMSGVEDVRNIIGADNWPDPGMQGSIEEFRIYNGALQADEIAATQALGPTQLLSTASPTLAAAISGTNLTLSWPLASAGFTLQWETNISLLFWTNGLLAPQIFGGQWQVTVPVSGPALYYRLAR
jgi:alpha-L-arabinofuranosidase